MLPVVALVGRPNVGKSTIFNALTRTRDALVADYEGLTRDRQYGIVDEEEHQFVLVDTGGMMPESHELAALTVDQVKAAIDEADLNVLVVDAVAGCTPEDIRIAGYLRATGKPVIVGVNKIDGQDESMVLTDFYQLGFEHFSQLAASHRRGIRQLSEQIASLLPEPEAVDEHDQEDDQLKGTRIAIVGRPNVGKSTLVNRLLGEDRVLAFDMPGTTRDSISIPWERDGKDYVLVDTAGVRRRSKVTEAVEKFSIIKSLQAIERADAVILLLAADEGVVEQDATLLGHILKAGRPLIVAINKWDGLSQERRAQTMTSFDRKLRFIPFVERMTISALHGSGLGELVTAIDKAYASSKQSFSSNLLTDILVRAFEAHQPPMVQGRTAKLRYAHLGGHHPLRIVIHGNRANTLPDSYKRYLINVFREELKLVGTPVKLDFRGGSNPFEGKKNPLTARQLAKRRRMMKHIKKRKK